MTAPDDTELRHILENLVLDIGQQVTDNYRCVSGLWEGISVRNYQTINTYEKAITLHTQKVTISPPGNMVLTVVGNMLKRGEEVPPNMTAVLVIELERIKQLTNPTEAGEL